jgi:hypothetical protein
MQIAMPQAMSNTMRNRVTGRSADRDHATLGGEAAQGVGHHLAKQESMSAGDRDGNGVRAPRCYSVVALLAGLVLVDERYRAAAARLGT